jgi:4-hydroxy-2-oxoheptanedioate aldolase
VTAFTRFRTRLADGETLLGSGVTFSDPRITEALAPSVDFIWLELEHSLIGPESVVAHVLAAKAADVPLLMRIPAGVTSIIKPAIDSGVGGLIIPQVRSVAEVLSVVADVRYAPLGRRGMGPLRPSNYGRLSGSHVVESENVFLAVQIETMEALGVVEEIAATPGIDALVVGPTDLSSSMGLLGQFEHPQVREGIGRIVAAAKANGLSVGVGVGDAASARAMIAHGVQWVQLSGAEAYLWQRFEQLRAAVGSGVDVPAS